MHEDRRDQPPPLSGSECLLQRGEVGVFTIDTEVDEVQPADRREVLTEHGDSRDNQGDDQYRRGQRAGAQGGDETAAATRLFDDDAVIAMGMP